MPKLTVYITNYNYGRYIRQAIESVLHQGFQDFQLLIIDDGSTDNSKEVIEDYATHPQIDVIYQQNKGLNITNNIALRLAKGQYIMRLDADDYLLEGALEKMVGQLENDPSLGMVFPDYYLVDRNNITTAEIKRHDFDTEVGLFDLPAHGACTMIRVDFLKSVGGYDESYSCQDGYELWIKFIARFKVVNIKEPLFCYRQHGENLTSNENRILDTRRTIKDDFILKNDISRPDTIAIIPVRDTRLKTQSLPFIKLGNLYLLDVKIEAALNSKLLTRVVVTSDDRQIENYIKEQYSGEDRVVFIERPSEMARYNVSLNETIEHVLEHPALSENPVEAFMILALEFPFLQAEDIDNAINSLAIFKADSLLSVRIERSTLYQHHGSGMVPILEQDKFTKLEREALYRGVGGLMLCAKQAYYEEKKLLAGKVGHVVVDELTAHGVFSQFDLEVARVLADKKLAEATTAKQPS